MSAVQWASFCTLSSRGEMLARMWKTTARWPFSHARISGVVPARPVIRSSSWMYAICSDISRTTSRELRARAPEVHADRSTGPGRSERELECKRPTRDPSRSGRLKAARSRVAAEGGKGRELESSWSRSGRGQRPRVAVELESQRKGQRPRVGVELESQRRHPASHAMPSAVQPETDRSIGLAPLASSSRTMSTSSERAASMSS
eukprot:870249-Prymnesium_polylepis.1